MNCPYCKKETDTVKLETTDKDSFMTKVVTTKGWRDILVHPHICLSCGGIFITEDDSIKIKNEKAK